MSSSFLRHYDETKTLSYAIPLISPTWSDGIQVVVLDGKADPEPVPTGTELELGQDASGEIQFTQGGSITFENVEKIVW